MLSGLTRPSFISTIDSSWNNLLSQSQILNQLNRFFVIPLHVLAKHPLAKTIGDWSQMMSICLTGLLFICLTLPQFTNDKQGLASILVISFILWFGGNLLAGHKTKKSSFIDALILLFFAVNVIAACASHYFAASIHGLLKLVVYILTYFLFCSQLRDKPQRQFVFVAILLACGTLLSLYGLYQYKIGVAPLATWEDPNIETQATRIYATFNNPNLFAGYLLPINMLSVSIVFACWNLGKWFSSLLALAITALLTIALILSGSRGVYIGAFAGYLTFSFVGLAKLWQMKTKRRFIIPLLLVFVPVLLVAIFHYLPGFEQRITSIFAGREHSSNSFRLNVWLSSLVMLKDNWLIGIGIGNQAFRLAYGLYMRSGFDALGTYCVPLEIAVETGLFGLLLFALIVINLLYRAHLSFWLSTGTQLPKTTNAYDLAIYTKWLIAGASIAIVALLMHGLVDTVFFRPQIQFIFYLLTAIIITNTIDSTTDDKSI